MGGLIYVMGGSIQGPLTGANEAYDPVADSWTTLAPMPGGRANFGMVADNGRLYVMGGEVAGSTNTCLQYEAASNSWVGINSLIQARQGFAYGLIGGKVYISQGLAVAVLGTTEEYPLPKTVYLLQKL